MLSVQSEVIIADTPETVQKAIQDNQDSTLALFFLDSSLAQGSDSGFWNGIVTSISHIFSGEEAADAQQQQIDSLSADMVDDVTMVQIDVSKEDLRDVQEAYDVTTVPFLIVFKRGIVVLKEVPTHETHDKILQVLNVHPDAVNDDGTLTITTVGETEVASSAPESTSFTITEEVSTETAAEEPVEEVPEETTTDEVVVLQPRASIVIREPAVAEQVRTSGSVVVDLRPSRVAPVVISQPVIQQKLEEPHVNPDDRRKYVHHQCNDVTTYDDEKAKYWRNSPFYVPELEDYEVPEDWWRNGYTPITDPERQQKRTIPASEVPIMVEPLLPPRGFMRPMVEPISVAPFRERPIVEPIRPRTIAAPTFPRYTAKVNTTEVTTNTTRVAAPIQYRPRASAPIVTGPVVTPTVRPVQYPTRPVAVAPRNVTQTTVKPTVQTVTKTSAPAGTTVYTAPSTSTVQTHLTTRPVTTTSSAKPIPVVQGTTTRPTTTTTQARLRR